jgi:hypothetical protein
MPFSSCMLSLLHALVAMSAAQEKAMHSLCVMPVSICMLCLLYALSVMSAAQENSYAYSV